MNLDTYISSNYPSQAAFAREVGVSPAQVTQWINRGFIVINGELYSPRRELETELPTPAKTDVAVFIAYSNNGVRGSQGEFNLAEIISGRRHAYVYKAESQALATRWMRKYSHNPATKNRVAEVISESDAQLIEPDQSEYITVDREYFDA
jgi:transposase-like protein